MEVIILAGGFGTRLQSIVKNVPKPMADINGRPFLSFLLDYLINQKVKKVLLSVCYKHEAIENYFGFRYKNIEIGYVFETIPLGTGGAIREALKYVSDDNVIVLNGDTFFCINLSEMYDFHRGKRSNLTIAVKATENCSRYGAVIIQNDKIVQFEEKASNSFGYINGGIYIINSKVISSIIDEFGNQFSFERDFIQKIAKKINVFSYISNDYFIDIGIPEDYAIAKKELPCRVHT